MDSSRISPNVLLGAGVTALFLCVTIIEPVAAQSLSFPPRPQQHVRDDAALLSQSAEDDLNRLLGSVASQRDVEIFVVTIDRMPKRRRTLLEKRHDLTIEDYAREMFNHYKIGDLPDNRGVLLLVSRDDRKCRIELGAGYSSRHDRVARQIIDKQIVPSFRHGAYEQGIKSGATAIANSLAGLPPTNHVAKSGIAWFWIALLAALATAGSLVGGSLLILGKRGWGWVVVGLVYIQYLALRNSLRNSTRGVRSRSGSIWGSDVSDSGRGYRGGGDGFYDGGGFGGGGFDGGGFDGGGGGFSDGGGASGDW